MNPWENDPYELPILADATYRCPCGGAASMDSFLGGPTYAHHKHYAIKCRMPSCKRSEIRMQDWKDTPAEAIRAWNRRCLERTTPTEEICARLGELGVEYDTYDLPNGEHGLSWIDGNDIEWEVVQQGENFRIHALQLVTPEQAIAATVGNKPKDNPRNYNPDGTPKIPNMNVGADPDWVDWVASLEHKEPLDLKEAVEQFMFEVICFGGDMGPNDCGGEHCPDEGMVYTNDFINGWVSKIAATVGTEPDEATMLKLHDRMNAALLDYKSAMGIDGGNGANTVPFVIEMHQIIEDAAKVGVGTCHCTTPDDAWCFSCSSCGKSFPRNELHIAHNHGEINYCPNCGARIEKGK